MPPRKQRRQEQTKKLTKRPWICNPWRAKFPYATAGLAATTVLVYLLLSEGALYAQAQPLQQVSFQLSNPVTALTHMFAHIGIIHMIGNIVPLIIFALVLELALLPQDVFAAFLASGVISAFIFGALNPATALIGGSAAVAGVVGAALFTRPAWSILAILLLPAAMSYAIMPAAQYLTTEHAVTLVQQTQAIQQNVTTLVQQNRTEEARELNKTLVVVEKKAEVVTKGIEREQKTPTEIPVHVYGFFVGIAYVLAFRRNEVKRGASELLVLKDAAVKILRGLRGLLGL